MNEKMLLMAAPMLRAMGFDAAKMMPQWENMLRTVGQCFDAFRRIELQLARIESRLTAMESKADGLYDPEADATKTRALIKGSLENVL